MKNKLLRFYLIFLSPLLIKYVFVFCFSDLSFVGIRDYFEDILFCLSILSLVLSGVLQSKLHYNLAYFLYGFYFILETTSYLSVSSNFSSSYMYLLIDSNPSEFHEFIVSYISKPIMGFFILTTIIVVLLNKFRFEINVKYNRVLGAICFLVIVLFLKLTGWIENNAYHNIVRGTFGYYELQNNFKINPNLKNDSISINSSNEVLVVVIGESTTRLHMQLYGYERPTNPMLNNIKDSLYLFNNVISTDIFTLKSVPQILTSMDISSSSGQPVYNLVELFNVIGFETYWLSNQVPIGYHENAISKIASYSKHFKFFNYIDDNEGNILDEVILPDYNEILNRKGRKVIFIKLMGTHFNYKNRYSKEDFSKFNTDPDLVSKQDEIINSYDNAVMYNDFIIYSLIESLEKTNKKSAFIYFSDHGENLYDEGTNFFGRSEDVLTKSMFEIPYIVWTSKNFELPSDFVFQPDRPFMADHTYESIGQLFGIVHKSINSNRSIFSTSFEPRKRIVLKKIDFDSYFKPKL